MANFGAILTILGGMVLFMPVFGDPYIAPKLAALSFALAVLWGRVIIKWFGGSAAWVHTPMEAGLWAMAFALAASTAYSRDIWLSLIGPRQFQFHSCLAFAICAGLYISASVLGREISWRGLKVASALSLIFMGAYAGAQLLHVDPLMPLGLPDLRAYSTIGGPVYFGAALVALLPLGYDLILSEKSAWARSLGALSMLAGVLGIAFSMSRGAMVAFLAGLAAYLWARTRTLPPRKWVVGALLLMLLVPFLMRWAPGSDSGRVELWKIAGRAFLESPLIGSGPDTFALVCREKITDSFLRVHESSRALQASAHNEVAQIAATMGALGLISYALLLLGVAIILASLVQGRSEHAPLLVAVVLGTFIQAKVNPVPLCALALVALVLGRASDEISLDTSPFSRRGLALLTLFFLAPVGVSALNMQAERHQYLGVRALAANDPLGAAIQFNAAAQKAFWEIEFRQTQLISLASVTMGADKAARPEMAQVAVTIAKEIIKDHPADANSYELYGAALAGLAYHTGAKTVDASLEAYTKAQKLAPTFVPLMTKRAALAEYQGKEQYRREIDGEISRVLALLPKGAF